MEIKILKEAGYEEALLGLSLSYGKEPNPEVAKRLSFKQGGHNKFLESIVVWLDINAPRYWWSQFDTYRVGTTKQSESTMHTILSRPLEGADFYGPVRDDYIDYLNSLIEDKDFNTIVSSLPQSFLQRRIVCTNYKVLLNIVMQRKGHKVSLWRDFIFSLKKDLEHPYFIIPD